VKAFLKNLLLPKGSAPRVIRGGLFRGLRFKMDFAHQTQLWLGLQERELARWFRNLSEGIHTAIDVGASEGIYTLYFLARTPARKVLSFEPSSENVAVICRNLELNGLETDSRLQIVGKFAGTRQDQQHATLDSFCPSIEFPCLVKIDVDGGEVDVLRGAQTLLELPGTRWIIEVHSEELKKECLRILEDKDYRISVVPNAWWRAFIPELRPIELNHWLVATR